MSAAAELQGEEKQVAGMASGMYELIPAYGKNYCRTNGRDENAYPQIGDMNYFRHTACTLNKHHKREYLSLHC